MEKISIISPGTAGVAQRISSEKKVEAKLFILKPNKLSACSQNQY